MTKDQHTEEASRDSGNMDTYYKRYIPAGMRMSGVGPYAVGQRGDIYSFEKQRLLKPVKNSSGYWQVFLKVYGGKARWYRIHRLVGSVWVKNRHPKLYIEVHHIDHNKDNNFYGNLKWVTHSQNIKLSYEGGRRKSTRPSPMTNRRHSAATKQKMRTAKLGENHPKFNGYYIYDEQKFASMQALADHLGTYVIKIVRMMKKGIITKEQPFREATV